MLSEEQLNSLVEMYNRNAADERLPDELRQRALTLCEGVKAHLADRYGKKTPAGRAAAMAEQGASRDTPPEDG